MSAYFGRWIFDGNPAPLDLKQITEVLAPYGPDNSHSYCRDGVNLLYCAFHATKESRGELQPYICQSGSVITWDGRLDNRAELIHLSKSLSLASADVSFVAAAYDRWGTDCFARLIGDWTLSVWNPRERSLILAKDPIGPRHLYYSFEKDQVTWCTILDPLVLFAERTFALDEEYIAGWFSFFPAAHLTPYVGIDSVSPSCYVRLERGRRTITKYWDFDSGKTIRYRTDAEYEEQFRTVFANAVERRLRSDAPILAELSGGMDSSAIVCMADAFIARGTVETPRLDTLSYYNDSEPNWNERPYFTKVEAKRGRSGSHIDVGMQESYNFESESDHFAAIPGPPGGRATEAHRQFAECIASQGHRVVLSGIGGDEVTGGVPTATPELMDLLARAQFRRFAHQLKVWALNKRRPWFHLFFETIRGFFPPFFPGLPKQMRPAPWLRSSFVKRHRAALADYPCRLELFGSLPTFQKNISTLGSLRRQLACPASSTKPLYEKRYPFLDRNFLEFMYAIPREQVVRPGQRRSLMRRALIDIVPNEILERRRKAFIARSPIASVSAQWPSFVQFSQHLAGSSLGLVDADVFRAVLIKARCASQIPVVPIMRTLAIERWLKAVQSRGLMNGRA